MPPVNPLSLVLALFALLLVASGSDTHLTRRSGWTPQQLQSYSNNAANLFSWQVAGLATNASDAQKLCQYRSNYGLIVSLGLDPPNEQCRIYNSSFTPSKRAMNATVNATVNDNIKLYNTNILATQLLSAFAPSLFAVPAPNSGPMSVPLAAKDRSALAYLCKNLHPISLDTLGIAGQSLVTAVCAAGNTTRPASPVPTDIQPGNRTVQLQIEYKQAQSRLFASLMRVLTPDDMQSNAQCDMISTSSHAAMLTSQGLDARTVQLTICRPTTKDFPYLYEAWTQGITDVFVAILESASVGVGWEGWVCGSLDDDGAHAVMLMVDVVVARFCREAFTGRPGRPAET